MVRSEFDTMTRKDIEKEVRTALYTCKATGMVDRVAMDFIAQAVEEKLARQEECLSVKRKDYIKALDERKDRLTDEGLGQFVKRTLWTVSEKEI
jgi:hypothetical protein